MRKLETKHFKGEPGGGSFIVGKVTLKLSLKKYWREGWEKGGGRGESCSFGCSIKK